MFGIYTTPSLDAPIPAWGDWIKQLKGRDTRIEMGIMSKAVKPSDPAGDEKGVALVKAVSDFCADTGPVVSIYPHAGFWTERVDDGVRIAKAVARKNVGTNFNLVHWQWIKQTRTVEETLKEALPHLFLVTINGLKGPATGRQQIRPLDDSDYDLQEFLGIVKKVGYAGPVGLQGYSVKEPPAEHLKRSMETWRKLTAALG
jgi:sugar phosphate isomerase/epimerase